MSKETVIVQHPNMISVPAALPFALAERIRGWGGLTDKEVASVEKLVSGQTNTDMTEICVERDMLEEVSNVCTHAFIAGCQDDECNTGGPLCASCELRMLSEWADHLVAGGDGKEAESAVRARWAEPATV